MESKAPMTERQIALVKQSWNQVVPIADAASAMFYDRLFEQSPHLRPLFAATDLPAQRAKLVRTISTVVGSLERIDSLLPVIRDLGKRHVGYGVDDSHYGDVGAALLWTLQTGLGDAWTAELADAWTRAYGVISGTMIEGAHEATGDREPTRAA